MLKLFDKPSPPSSKEKPYFFSVAKTEANIDPIIRGDLFKAPITGAIECSRALGEDGSGMREMFSNKDFKGKSAILVGHSTETDYGGFSPTEFANMLMQAPEDRLNGMTFYMLGCHMDVFCERVASILNERGYQNVTFVAMDEYSCQVEGQNVNWYPTNLQRKEDKLQFYGAPKVRGNITNLEEMNQFEQQLKSSKRELATAVDNLKKTRQVIQELTEQLKLPQVDGDSKKEMEIKLQQFQEEERRLNRRCAASQRSIDDKELSLEVMRNEFMQQFILGQVNANAKDVMNFLSQYGKIIKTPMDPSAQITVSNHSKLLQARPNNRKGVRVLAEIQEDIKKKKDVSANFVPPGFR